jgi:hypothetical protein
VQAASSVHFNIVRRSLLAVSVRPGSAGTAPWTPTAQPAGSPVAAGGSPSHRGPLSPIATGPRVKAGPPVLASPLGWSAARAVSSFVEEEEEDPGMGDIAVVGSRAGECRAWRTRCLPALDVFLTSGNVLAYERGAHQMWRGSAPSPPTFAVTLAGYASCGLTSQTPVATTQLPLG